MRQILKKMKFPQIYTIRDTLKVIDNQGLYKILRKIIKKANRNKVFEEGTIDVVVYDALACNSS